MLRLNDTVLASASFPPTLDLIDRSGLTVLPLPTTEISKLNAGLSCMGLRWAAALPGPNPAVRLAATCA